MKKELAVVSVWALLQATPFINWRANPEIAKDKNPQVLPARIISQTNTTQLGLTMMSMAGTILISDDHK